MLNIKPLPDDPNILLTEWQMSVLLNVSVRTAQDWRRRGVGPDFVKLEKSVRYRRDILLKWIEGNARSNTSQCAVG